MGGRYRITFKVLEENPGVFMFRKLNVKTYEENGMTYDIDYVKIVIN